MANTDLSELIDGVHEEIMIAMLDVLQDVAQTCSKIAARRLNTLHDTLQKAFEDERRSFSTTVSGGSASSQRQASSVRQAAQQSPRLVREVKSICLSPEKDDRESYDDEVLELDGTPVALIEEPHSSANSKASRSATDLKRRSLGLARSAASMGGGIAGQAMGSGGRLARSAMGAASKLKKVAVPSRHSGASHEEAEERLPSVSFASVPSVSSYSPKHSLDDKDVPIFTSTSSPTSVRSASAAGRLVSSVPPPATSSAESRPVVTSPSAVHRGSDASFVQQFSISSNSGDEES